MRLHPVTGEDMGTATYLQAYVLLSALFMHIASTQDAAREAAENAPLAGRPLALRPLAVRHANKAARSSQRADAFDVGGHAGGAGCDCQDDKGAGMIDLMYWWDWAVGVMLAWLLAWRWS